MLRKIVIVIVAAAVIAFVPTGASARGGFGGGGWRGGGWGWRRPAFGALGVGVSLGLAGAYAGWGPGWGWDDPGWGGDPCLGWRQVWTGWGWRMVPVNVCW
jgi:hypothetical protein